MVHGFGAIYKVNLVGNGRDLLSQIDPELPDFQINTSNKAYTLSSCMQICIVAQC